MMSDFSVLRGASYIMAHTPDMVLHNGTTQTTERIVNPESEYLKEVVSHLRCFEDVLSYIPNQVYIGNMESRELTGLPLPWHDKKAASPRRQGKFGEIMPQDEFYGLIQICDAFDLVKLEKDFAVQVKEKLSAHGLFKQEQLAVLDKNQDGESTLKALVEEEHAEGLYQDGRLVGVVKKAHDVDINLSAHVMLENLVSKASSVLALLHLLRVTGIGADEIQYVIDCSEEACGDMNQRGGGNFAKAAAEVAGLSEATGCDVRGFCAGPAHALLDAASLVKAGTFQYVAVTAGGCTAKLGMNGKDHVKKGLPVLEDMIAGFAALISVDDGENPQIRTDIVGRHTVGTGSSPQAVIGSLVMNPLDDAGLRLQDIDRYAPEMQNPDITKPAGAGDVPEANYKMIAALGVKRGELERAEIPEFVKEHGMTGWAPTQGHIPSGVPYLGMCREEILRGDIERAMIIGKGSLFLGRMTNLFDGVSLVIQANHPETEAAPSSAPLKQEKEFVIGIAAEDTEYGKENVLEAMKLAKAKGYSCVLIEGKDSHKKMEFMLKSGEIDGAVTMHYPFPIGVSTVGRVPTPGKGKEIYMASTTGTSDTDRVCSLVKNTVYGIIAAKAAGVEEPTVGILNIDGARQAEKALVQLKEQGFDFKLAMSSRKNDENIMRGNDLLTGSADVMVMDSLTGNLMMKVFSASSTGGSYEAVGFGYGPGIGENYDKLIMIVSRASGAPVIAGAVEYANQLLKNGWQQIARAEFKKANKAGLKAILESCKSSGKSTDGKKEAVKAPLAEVVTAQIAGIEVMDLEDAVAVLWQDGIYAESGMGCTGPIVLVNDGKLEQARELLSKAGYIS